VWKERVQALAEIGKDEDADGIKSWLRSQYAESIRERRRGAEPQDFDLIGTEFHRWVRDHEEKLGLNSSTTSDISVEADVDGDRLLHEEGKGFAVVADEIKNLAERTGASTKEIAQLIGNVQSEAKDAVDSVRDGARSVEEGVGLSLEAGEALKKILDTSKQSTVMAQEIEKATMEQTRGIRQVGEAIQRINTMVQQISKATQEQSRGSEQIMHSAEKMRDMTRQVKMSTEEQAKGSRQITEAVESVTERVQQIAKAVNEQKRGSEIIMQSVESGRTTSRQSVNVVAEMNKMVEELAKQAEHLKQSIGRFKVKL